jgi:hypothetical protein
MVLMQGLSDLCLYLGKYLFDPDLPGGPSKG